MCAILLVKRYPSFSFNISNIKNGVYHLCKFESISKKPFTIYSDTNPLGEIDYLVPKCFNLVTKKNVSFDMIEISSTEYTKHRLCVTLWHKENNILSDADMKFIPIFCFKNIIEFIGHELTEKQKSALNKMLKSYAQKWGFPCYQINF